MLRKLLVPIIFLLLLIPMGVEAAQAAGEDPIVAAAWQLLTATGVVGIVTSFGMQGLKIASGWINRQPAMVKQLLVLLIGQVLTHLGNYLGMVLPMDLSLIDAPTLQGIVGAGFSMGFYEVLKAIKIIKPKT